MNTYVERAIALTGDERKALQDSRGHPAEYTRKWDDPTPAQRMSPKRRQEVAESICELFGALYGHQFDPTKVVWGSMRYPYRPPMGGSGNGSAYMGIDQTARLLWARDHLEVHDAGILDLTTCTIGIGERSTRWVDEHGRLHRRNAPAVVDPYGAVTYSWHGTRIDRSAFTDPKKVNPRQLMEEPMFSIIGGFEGLATHPGFTRIAREGAASIYEGGGVKTYVAKRREAAGLTLEKGTRIWSEKPRRFLLDPTGQSGWISPNVRTIRGAQQSLLRRKLSGIFDR